MFNVHVVLSDDGAWQETMYGNAIGETGVPSAKREDHLSEEHQDAGQDSCDWRKTYRREDLHDPENVGFRKLCQSTETGMGKNRIHPTTLRTKLGIWITSTEKYDQRSRNCCTGYNAQAFPV